MPDGQVLEFTRVTKRFNEVTAVSDFSARIEPGAVTAFLGPNGAGKTTTLRMLLGQVRPTSGTATIGGAPYSDLRQPLRVIGSVLEETAYRPRRTATRQLTIAAKANDIPLARVAEVLALVGLENEADSRIGGFSLGMRQRLSVAHALLGDPGALVFDEPANGLDPEGIRWMRLLMRRLADEGRTVLVSSHVLSEVEQVADHVLVLSKGQLVLSSGIEELADPSAGAVIVDAADRAALTRALATAGFDIEILRSGLTVRGTDARHVGEVAADAGIALTTLIQRGPTLEDVFIQLTRGGRLEPRLEGVPAPATAGLPLAIDEASGIDGRLDAAAADTAHDDAADGDDAGSTGDVTSDETDRDDAAGDRTDSDESTHGEHVGDEHDDTASADAATSAIAADVATAVPGGPVAAAVTAAGAGAAIASPAAPSFPEAAPSAPVPASSRRERAIEARNRPADGGDAAPAPESDDGDARTPSFDDILFGAPGAGVVSETPSTFPGSDDAAADASPSDDDVADDETPVADTDHGDADIAPADHADAADQVGIADQADIDTEGHTDSADHADTDAGDVGHVETAADADTDTDTDADANANADADAHSVDDEGIPATADQDAAEGEPSADETVTAPSDAAGEPEAVTDSIGVEVFADLGAETIDEAPAGDDEVPPVGQDETHDSPADAAPAEDEAADDDPRAAAVSSMLADAARAYFHDEPRDYPYAAADHAGEPAEAETLDDDGDVPTRVIDIVEAPSESAEQATDGPADDHEHEHEHEGEHTHEGEHEHEGEHGHTHGGDEHRHG